MIYLLLGLGLKLVYKCAGASLEAHGRREYKEEMGDADMGAPGETQTEYGIVKLSRDQGPSAEECSSLFPDGIVQSYGGSDRLIAAPAAGHHMSELGRFGSGTGVSLPLGLQHCEGGSLSISGGGHHGFAGMGEDDTYNPPSSFFSGY